MFQTAISVMPFARATLHSHF